MDDIVCRLENIVKDLTRYVYVLEIYDCYDGYSDIKGCYFKPEKAYEEANNIIDYLPFSLKDVEKLQIGDVIESDEDVNSKIVKIHKFLIE